MARTGGGGFLGRASFVALQTPGMGSRSPLWVWCSRQLSGKVLCPAWPLPHVHTVPEVAGVGGSKVNKVKLGTKLSDIRA